MISLEEIRELFGLDREGAYLEDGSPIRAMDALFELIQRCPTPLDLVEDAETRMTEAGRELIRVYRQVSPEAAEAIHRYVSAASDLRKANQIYLRFASQVAFAMAAEGKLKVVPDQPAGLQ